MQEVSVEGGVDSKHTADTRPYMVRIIKVKMNDRSSVKHSSFLLPLSPLWDNKPERAAWNCSEFM